MKKKLLIILLPLIIVVGFLPVIIPIKDLIVLREGFVEVYPKAIESERYQVTAVRPKNWKSLKQFSKHLKNAVIVSEDSTFYQHDGIDLHEIKSAVEETIEGKRMRGASTISQQLVKNIFLSSDRSFIRKGREIVITLVMEKLLTKDKILEVYLNIVHMGPGVYGGVNASRYYFQKDVANLNPEEAAFLVMLLPNPDRYSESFRKKERSEYASKIIANVLDRMAARNMISEEDAASAKARRLNFEKVPPSKNSAVKARGHMQKHVNTYSGDDYEKMYRNDPDLKVKDIEYDDDALIDPETGVSEEFQVE